MVKQIAVVGPHGCGKTALIQRYVKQRFSESYCGTVISDTTLDSMNNIIWDTPGNTRFQHDVDKILEKSKGIILCFSPNDSNSFNQAWAMIGHYEKPVVMAATKTDIEPFYIRDEWSSEARNRNAKIISTAASTGKGISQVFREILDVVDEEDISLKTLSEQLGSCINYGASYVI